MSGCTNAQVGLRLCCLHAADRLSLGEAHYFMDWPISPIFFIDVMENISCCFVEIKLLFIDVSVVILYFMYTYR